MLVAATLRADDDIELAQVPPAAPAKPQAKVNAGKPAAVKPAAVKPANKPAAEPPTDNAATRQQPPPNMIAAAAPMERLAAIPAMFGDLPSVSQKLRFSGGTSLAGAIDVPLAAGGGRMKIAEDNSPLPEDRAFFLYNHYAHVGDAVISQGVPGPTTMDLDRFTFGVEKTFLDRCWSVELRMPLAANTDYSMSGFNFSDGRVGNLEVVLKRLVYETECTAVSVGLGIDTPTGSDLQGNLLASHFTVHNEAVHLMPFVGAVRKPNARWFWSTFLQVDVATNGDHVELDALRTSPTELGVLSEQTLLYADFSVGYWLLPKDNCGTLCGLAAIVETHCTTGLGTGTTVATPPASTNQLTFGPRTDNTDIFDFTVGLHAELRNGTAVRVGATFPFTSGDNRAFDAELQVQVERRF